MRIEMRLAPVVVASCLALLSCGGGGKDSPPADNPKPVASGDTDNATPAASGDAVVDAGPTEADKRAQTCSAFEIDLMNALSQSACEVPNPKPDDKPRDLKNVLDVKVTASSPSVVGGGHVDLTVVFTNKGKDPLPLDFTVDPLPRFVIEVYDPKGHRADLPPGDAPARKDHPAAAIVSTARVLVVTNGTAKVTVGWDAKKVRWAPEKLKGTPPEQGYPRVPTGPLGKGKYTLRVVTPLVGVFEGSGREISAPKIEVAVN
jgi:hypothetical protein